MLKLIFCVRRLRHLSAEEFHRYWLQSHGPLVREVAPLLKIRRYVQSHSFSDPRITQALAARQCRGESFDGIAELWWDSIEDIVAVGACAEARAAGRRLLEDEKRFIDLASSALFYSHEHVVIGESWPADAVGGT